MNLSHLEVPPPQQVQRTSTEASHKDADFLSLRLLNKRTRVRLSPEPVDLQPLPGKGQLFAVASLKGWFVAAIRHASSDIALVFSPLTDLRLAFSNATPETAEHIFTPLRTLSFAPATPNIIVFASLDTRLVVGLTQGPVLVFDTARLFAPGSDEITPLHSFPSTTSSAPREILPNPGDMPDLVAVLRYGDGTPGSQLVEIVDVQKLDSVGGWRSGNSPDATPTSLSWSPKGKQIAVGLQSGDIITFSPLETGKPKLVYGRPPSANNQSIISTTWLSPSTFHAIYAPPGSLSPDAEQTHIVLSADKNKHTVSDVKLTTPYFPSPGIRPPGSFTVVLRNWEPAKFILLVGDSSSSDIGVIGNTGDDSWYNFSLEETATPSLPLDKDMNDTVLIALELDLTSTEPYRYAGTGEPSDLPPPPIMYAYVNDGTLLGWYIVNSQGQVYNGMVPANTDMPTIIAPAMSTSISQKDMHMSTAPVTPVSESVNTFGQQTSSQPVFGQSSTPSAFGQSAFGQSQPSAFGQPSVFSQASPFGEISSSFRSSVSSTVFGPFSSAASAKFGQATVGFGASTSPTQPTSSPLTSPPSHAEDAMASDDGPAFEGMSLGETSHPDSKSSSPFVSGSIFGQAALSPRASSDDKPRSAFGSSGFGAIKPATGFGAFSNITSQPGAFGSTTKDTTTSESPKPSGAFGQSGFSQPAFGRLGFGQPSVFGTSGFAATSMPTAQPASGGFGAFSSGGPVSFASATSQSGGNTKTTPTSGGFGAFARNGPSAFATVALSDGGDSKPVWASGGSQGAFEPMQSRSGTKSDFGDTNKGNFTNSQNKSTLDNIDQNNASTLGGDSALASGKSAFSSMQVKDETKNVEIPSTPKLTSTAIAPVSPLSSPVSPDTTAFHSVHTRSLSPLEKDVNSSPTSPTPFKSVLSVSGTGAFGQLKTSSTGFFKPAEGFGVFGSNINKDSPFYNPPKEVGTKPVSVFASPSGSFTPTDTPSDMDSTTPAFGSPSVLRSSKHAFGSTSTLGDVTKSAFGSPFPPAPSTSELTSGGFSAFGNNSAFGSLVPANTSSFGDLLRGGEEAKDPSKPIKSISSVYAEDSLKPLELTQEEPRSVSQSSEGGAKGSGILSQSPTQEHPHPSFPITVESEITTTGELALAQTSPEPNKIIDGRENSEEINMQSKDKDVGEPPQASLLSQSSSFVEVSVSSDDDELADILNRPTDSGSDLEDDTRSFLSESFSSEGSPDGELSDEEAGDDEEERSRSPSSERRPDTTSDPLLSTPQAKSRSPSTTPKPESLSVKVSKSSSPLPVLSVPAAEKSPARSTRGGSTTPPGSPSQGVSSAILPETPVPVSAVVAPSPFGQGLGRPSTRPARSSPLASAAPLAPSAEGIHTSKSPAAVIPRPASPKQPFGVWGAGQPQKLPPSKDDEASQSKLSKTPPLPSVGTSSVKLSDLSGHPSTSSLMSNLPSDASGSLGKATSPNVTDIKLSAPSLGTPDISLFSPQPSRTLIVPPHPALPAAGDQFEGPSRATPDPLPAVSDNIPICPPAVLFGRKPTPTPSSTPSSSHDFARQPAARSGSTMVPLPASIIGAQKQAAAATVATPTSAEIPGQGMQAQCALLVTHLTKELDTLRQHAQRTSALREELSKASGLSHHKDNLTDASHWTLGDIKTWGQVLRTLQDDIEQINEIRIKSHQALRELESSMLRVETKKEEIARFNKAKTDPEFAKLLKVRTLGPEHMETQSQLRRDIGTIRDRIQKLEDHLEASKKKITQMKNGKPGLRAPSLDTINRTYHNIDIAIDYQADQVTLLAARLKQLDISLIPPPSNLPIRDSLLPDAKRPYNDFSYGERTATSALNGERSAHKLKLALLSVRQQPLLNTNAAIAPAAPLAFTAPAKAAVKAEPQSPSLNFNLKRFSTSETTQSPAFNVAALDESQTHDTGPRRREGRSHGQSVKMKRSSNFTPALSFDWGPLPNIPQKKSLPFGFSNLPPQFK